MRGHFFNTYPERDEYRYNPWSRSYVNPNGDHYAQKHPDEDFAETFAVWLTPRSNWQRTYRRYPTALKKLRFTARVVEELGDCPPLVEVDKRWMIEPYTEVKMTVAEFMKATPKHYYPKATGYVDPDLKVMFRSPPQRRACRGLLRRFMRAETFIKTQKQRLISRIAYWVGVDSVVVFDLLDKLITRAKSLNLWLEKAQEEKKLIELTTYVAALCTRYKNTGQYLV
ncbi:MAG: hypothetical protein D6735_12225 [Acidobacteria bacterium]|nr:MAG: hypothetical protein D6735_12225 [Acidobacteriota bacterium]